MTAWMAALFIGFLVVGLSRDRTSRRAHGLALLVIVVVLGYQAAKTHAF
jgi:hypothetical protein